jgi:hypothetical protein
MGGVVFTNCEEMGCFFIIIIIIFYWAELGFVKGCLYLVGGWGGGGGVEVGLVLAFLWVRAGLYVKDMLLGFMYYIA